MNFTKQSILLAIAAILGVIVPIYLLQLIRGDVTLEYYTVGDFRAKVGLSNIADNLTIDISNISFNNDSYSAIRSVQFLVINKEARSVEAPTRFLFFTEEGNPLNSESVLDIQFKSLLASSDIVLWDQWNSPRYGPGLELLSDLPGNSRGLATLLLDESTLLEAANFDVEMRKVSRGGEFLERVSPFGGTITFTPINFASWLAGAAALWGAAWLLVNIALGNYSTGARIVFWLLARINAEILIPEGYKKLQNGSDRVAGPG